MLLWLLLLLVLLLVLVVLLRVGSSICTTSSGMRFRLDVCIVRDIFAVIHSQGLKLGVFCGSQSANRTALRLDADRQEDQERLTNRACAYQDCAPCGPEG